VVYFDHKDDDPKAEMRAIIWPIVSLKRNVALNHTNYNGFCFIFGAYY